MASLKDYERKRARGKTPEPFGKGRKSKEPIFVIQRHDARRLHYDFRLERDGALASWAVPKGVPLEPGQQHLAVHVEDHPLSYATFEGEIPAGNYGAGTVEIWDHGTYELVEEKANGGLTVRLHGERLDGLWTLVPARLGGDPKNWLIVRKKEAEATPQKPRVYRPMLATLAADVPAGEGWLFEVKWDGFRAIATIARRRRRAREPQRELARRPLPDGRPHARASAPDSRLRARRRSRGASTRTAERRSPRCSRARRPARTSTSRSTCSRWRASR